MAPKLDPNSVDWSFLPKHQLDELKKMYKPDFFKQPHIQWLFKEHKMADGLLERRPALHVLASPLIEVLSVTLHKNLDDGTSSDIYGTIKIVDGEGAIFDIFKQTFESPVSVKSGEPLMLSMPRGRAITPSDFVKMEVALEERVMKDGSIAGIEFVKKAERWDVRNEVFDNIITTKVDGERGFALIQYVAYRHAVFVTLKMSLHKEEGDGSSSNRARVYGRIVARCGDKYATTLFDKKVNESVVLEYGDYIELSKPVVAVPAWSSLVIDAQLWDSDRNEQIFANPSMDISAKHEGRSTSRVIEGQNVIIKLELNWCHAHMQSSEETSDGKVPLAKKQRTEDFNFRLTDLRKALEQTIRAQMEVFSVSIHNTVDKEVNIWGEVKAKYSLLRPSFLFRKEKTCSQRLFCNQLLPIEFPVYCTGSLICGIDLDLKDSNDRIISWGIVWWHYEQDFNRPHNWFDKKLCSVVPGDNGSYAAIHYSIFNGGLQAAIRIQLKHKAASMKYSAISGTICCEYTGFDYSSTYDKEYFRRKLFIRGVGDPPLAYGETDSNILLFDSCVSVPRGSALVVDVDLNVLSGVMDLSVDPHTNKNNVPESIEGQLIFSTVDTVEHLAIDQLSHRIEVSVEWRNVPFVPPKDQ